MGIADVLVRGFGAGTGIEFRAHDGSRAGPREASVRVEVRSQRAVNYLVQSPGELGLARAYVSGHLDIHGDMHEALSRLWSNHDDELSRRERLDMLRALGLRSLRPVAPPPEEVRLRGRIHSKVRDAEAVSHHYDVGNRFYRWVLGPSMAYTCAVYPRADATLEEAQATKFDLVCRKLGLRPGMRLLDVGCGWGGMVVHAAKHYGVEAIGATLSRDQAEWGQRTVEETGLSDRAEVRWLDYRDVAEGDFDAISSIGLTEHVGKAQLSSYFDFLLGKLRPQGRLLNHTITRHDNVYPAIPRRSFLNRYVFPDGELLGPGRIASAMHDAGFELRHEENLREHYARTVAAWSANLQDHWEEAVAEVGEGRARVWRLYLAGARVSFEWDTLELHQMLGVRTTNGAAGMPLRPDWEPAAGVADMPAGSSDGSGAARQGEPAPTRAGL